ncbi:MAG TPA: alpha/beta fold hydrolase [Longimicrobium sp.]|nr:alpha/beta fold hydrolase [Longimicrobium sp.]
MSEIGIEIRRESGFEASSRAPRPARTFGIALILLLAACDPPPPARSAPASAAAPTPAAVAADSLLGQHAGTFTAPVTRPVEVKYLLHLPFEYNADTTRRFPLILYLHGGSLRGADPERLRRMGLPAVAERDSAFPFIVLSPLLPEGRLWTDTEALMALLEDVQARYRVDAGRVYVTGHSVGGNGAWYAAYRHPERFAAAIPMAGPTIPWWATRLKDVPVWAFHGARDTIVPLSETTEMVDALRREGAREVELTVLEGRDHFILDLYEDRNLYHWLLRHRRAPAPPL